MKNPTSVKVIFDTNIWISFLIGKRLRKIADYIADEKLIIITSERLFDELVALAERPKLKKYFPPEKLHELVIFLRRNGLYFLLLERNEFLPDPKDAFLLDLIEISDADFLVTGDRELLRLAQFKNAQILSVKEFEDTLHKVFL
jgi:putative PIN family toxin of toxin-antitoxin system